MTVLAADETLTIENYFASVVTGIEFLEFAYDTVLDRVQIQHETVVVAPNNPNQLVGTDGADTIAGTVWTSSQHVSLAIAATDIGYIQLGTTTSETLDGVAGDDLLNVGGGNDTLICGCRSRHTHGRIWSGCVPARSPYR